MSRDAVASAYARMLSDGDYLRFVRVDDEALAEWDLTTAEEQMLRDGAVANGHTFASDDGPVMSYLRSGPPLSQRVASVLGIALNKAHGLPTASLQEPGFRGACDCCPWGHPKIPDLHGMLE